MKDYRTSMDHLSFSPDQKQAMAARLAAATPPKAAPPHARPDARASGIFSSRGNAAAS